MQVRDSEQDLSQEFIKKSTSVFETLLPTKELDLKKQESSSSSPLLLDNKHSKRFRALKKGEVFEAKVMKETLE